MIGCLSPKPMLWLSSGTQPCANHRRCDRQRGLSGAPGHVIALRLVSHASSGEPTTSATDMSGPSDLPANSKEAMLARIAKAKVKRSHGKAGPVVGWPCRSSSLHLPKSLQAYKAGSAALTPVPAVQPVAAPSTPVQQQGQGSQRAAIDWGAVASFIQSPKELQQQGDGLPSLQQQQQQRDLSPEKQAQEEAAQREVATSGLYCQESMSSGMRMRCRGAAAL